jgi:phosphoserine aminotransferase
MNLQIPAELLPTDGRFGSGPSKVRAAQLRSIVAPASPMGTSHRKAPVKNLVANIKEGMRELFSLPDGYKVVLGNGGASLLWDAIAFTLAERHVQAATFGEFSRKAARAVGKVPWIERVDVREAPPGSVALCSPADGVDTYLYPHNETSTGALSPVRRIGSDALTVVDATSAAGGVLADISRTDVYYFSPQKCFGADGGLWIAFFSPAALERVERLAAQRWVPDMLNLQLAVQNSRKDQTLNTPAIATLLMIDSQIHWMLNAGGLKEMARRTAASSRLVYSWAEERDFATPFVAQAEYRSPVVATIDFDSSIDTAAISRFLRQAGIVDIDPYRSLGRNQFRFGLFPNVEYDDVAALLRSIDWAIESGIGTPQS